MNPITHKYFNCLWPMAYGLWRPSLRSRKGQAPPFWFRACSGWVERGAGTPCLAAKRAGQVVVEYLLMLALVVGMALIFVLHFYTKILGGMFTIVGMVLGAGTPTGP